jgi:hypothetical protein
LVPSAAPWHCFDSADLRALHALISEAQKPQALDRFPCPRSDLEFPGNPKYSLEGRGKTLTPAMFAKTVLSREERAVDPRLGYPRGYAKLCRHAFIQPQGLITPFTVGPPQRFLPYKPQPEDVMLYLHLFLSPPFLGSENGR